MTTPQSDTERAREVLAEHVSDAGRVCMQSHQTFGGIRSDQALRAMLAFAALNRPAQSGVVERLIAAAKGVLLSAERPGSRAEYGMGPEGEVWHDYQEVGQPSLVALEAALASLQAGEAAPVVETLAQRQARELMVPGSGSALASDGGQSYAATPPAPETAQSVPEGCKLVPVEQIRDWYTQGFAMFNSLIACDEDHLEAPTPQFMVEMECLLAASPHPDKGEGGVE